MIQSLIYIQRLVIAWLLNEPNSMEPEQGIAASIISIQIENDGIFNDKSNVTVNDVDMISFADPQNYYAFIQSALKEPSVEIQCVPC